MSSSTWFVEDINLSTTTLRFARTNEVSTVNSYAIAGSKIINCNRSPGALVVFNIILHVSYIPKGYIGTI
jgi:Mechanosensitive ion channel